jgi:hypothetical protein
MRSVEAAFYDPYVWQTARSPRRISLGIAAVVIGVLVLLALIAADVSAYEAIPAKITIERVDWMVGNFSIGNSSGFTTLSGHAFPENLVCEIFCPNFDRASVSSPFTLASSSFAYPWFEYVNLTIQAPSSGYDGTLTITLGVALPS